MKKKNGQIRCFIDFHNLRKACLKDESSCQTWTYYLTLPRVIQCSSSLMDLLATTRLRWTLLMSKRPSSEHPWTISITRHAFWPQECRRQLLSCYDRHFSRYAPRISQGLCWRYSGRIEENQPTCRRSQESVLAMQAIQPKDELFEVCIRSIIRQVIGLLSTGKASTSIKLRPKESETWSLRRPSNSWRVSSWESPIFEGSSQH